MFNETSLPWYHSGLVLQSLRRRCLPASPAVGSQSCRIGNVVVVPSSTFMVLERMSPSSEAKGRQEKERWRVVHRLPFRSPCPRTMPADNTLVLFPAGTLSRATPETLLRCQGTRTRVAHCYVDVNMLSYRHGQTQKQTHNGSLRTTRPRSSRTDQGLVWVSLGRGGYQAGLADSSQAGGRPHPSPSQGTALSSPPMNGEGSSRAELINRADRENVPCRIVVV